MRLRAILWVVLVLSCSAVLGQEITSGPTSEKTPELRVFDTTGPNTGSEVDYVADRKGKPTVYVFIAADKWDRPVARFIKQLDAAVAKDVEGGYLVAVWLSDDLEKAKTYLPQLQRSINLQGTALTYYTGDKAGPADWMIHGDAHLTAVVSNEGKVVKSFAYRSVNESDVAKVLESLKKSIVK